MIGRIAIVFLGVIAGAIEIQSTKYFLVETIQYDNGSRLSRYLKAFDNLSDCMHERAASPRYACVPTARRATTHDPSQPHRSLALLWNGVGKLRFAIKTSVTMKETAPRIVLAGL